MLPAEIMEDENWMGGATVPVVETRTVTDSWLLEPMERLLGELWMPAKGAEGGLWKPPYQSLKNCLCQ